jgi:hypothetical protein
VWGQIMEENTKMEGSNPKLTIQAQIIINEKDLIRES